MNQHIFIVHGWMHSSGRYERLKKDLEKAGPYEVTLYELPGFGDTPVRRHHHLLEDYRKGIETELEKGSYDYAVGHSMGGNVLLRAMDGKQTKTKLILLSPAYAGVGLLKPLTIFMPVLPLVFLLLKVPGTVTEFFIKSIALFTVNQWKQIDEQIVKDARRASPMAAACAMLELAWDRWRVKQWKCKKPVLILGEKDRIITPRKMRWLYKDIGGSSVYYIERIGHTAVVEAYDELLALLLKVI